MATGLLGSLGLGLAGGAVNALSNLFQRKKGKYSWQDFNPTNVSIELQKLGELPPSPQRDYAIQQLSNQANMLNPLQNQAYSTLNSSVDDFIQKAGGIGDNLGGLASQFQINSNSGANPYLTYYGDPGGTEGRLQGIKDRDVNAAFSEYGTQGSEALRRMGQVMSSGARTGTLNSGLNRRQQEAERMRLMQAKNEALAQGEKFVQGTMQNVFSNYNQGLQNKLGFLQGAADVYRTQADLAKAIPDMRMRNAQTLGEQYKNTLQNLVNTEGAARNEQIARNQANTALENDQRMRNQENNLNLQKYNFEGKQMARTSAPSTLDAFNRGFSAYAPYGSLFGQEGGLFGGSKKSQNQGYTPQYTSQQNQSGSAGITGFYAPRQLSGNPGNCANGNCSFQGSGSPYLSY